MTALVKLPYKIGPSDLTVPEERFVQEYVISGNAGHAYRLAYGEERSKKPASAGRSLLMRPDIIARLHAHQEAIANMSVKATATLVRELEEIVDADVTELIHIRNGACRWCWGVGGMYQWKDEVELERAIMDAIQRQKPTPECEGGFGYSFLREPASDCKKCEGEGIQQVRLAPSDQLSRGARRLYKGLECNPDGSVKKLLLHDQLAARQELHRIRGMHIERSVSVNMNGNLPNAKEIAANPEKVNDFLENLKK